MQEVKAGVEPLTLTNLPLHCAHPLGLLGSWDMDGNPTSRPPPPSPGPEPHISHADRFVHRTTGHVHWPWASVGDETKIFGGTDGCLGQSWTQHSGCYRKTEKCHKKYILFQHCSRRTMPWVENWRTPNGQGGNNIPRQGWGSGWVCEQSATSADKPPSSPTAPIASSPLRVDNSTGQLPPTISNRDIQLRIRKTTTPPIPNIRRTSTDPPPRPPPRSRPDTHRRHDNLLLLHL